MIIYKVLVPVFLFVKSEVAEKVDDPCSKFDYYDPLVKCPSEKPVDDYLECFDLIDKEELECNLGYRKVYYCWSRHDNNDDDLKNVPISAAGSVYNNAEVNDIINTPFTASFYINETHVTCHDNEEWSETIVDGFARVYCQTSTGYYAALFNYYDKSSM